MLRSLWDAKWKSQFSGYGEVPRDAAKQQLQLAKDNLDSTTTQLADIKAQLASSQPSPTFNSPPASTATAPPTLPGNLTGPNNVPSGFSPNIPSTKQMDNQMTLLWERLSRLVYTMNQTAADKSRYYLIQVDTGIVPVKRKNELLFMHYHLSCGTTVDVYPRAAAVNIINEKYKDTRVGFAALLQFFSYAPRCFAEQRAS